MDNAANREAIALALSEVDGVTGYRRRPQNPAPGDAWPLWRQAERADGFVFTQTFAIMVILPSQEQDADEFADSHGEALADALESVLYIETMAPAVVATSAGEMLALLITGRTE
jgi:hypothetical protein